MGAADLTAWRRQNSDVVNVVLSLTDGTTMKGTILLPRDRTLRELMCMPEPFMEFECGRQGSLVLAKSIIGSIRQATLPSADQIEKRLRQLEKYDSRQILGVPKTATKQEVHAAYIALARAYHPDRYSRLDMPSEMSEYVDTMARRINMAYADLESEFEVEAAREAARDAARAASRQAGAYKK